MCSFDVIAYRMTSSPFRLRVDCARVVTSVYIFLLPRVVPRRERSSDARACVRDRVCAFEQSKLKLVCSGLVGWTGLSNKQTFSVSLLNACGPRETCG